MKKLNLPLLVLLLVSFLSVACAASSNQSPLTETEARGRQIFTQNCASCHSTQPGVEIVGPSLGHIATQAASLIPGMDSRAYIEQSVRDPGAYIHPGFPDVMPKDFDKKLSAGDLEALLAYLLTLE